MTNLPLFILRPDCFLAYSTSLCLLLFERLVYLDPISAILFLFKEPTHIEVYCFVVEMKLWCKKESTSGWVASRWISSIPGKMVFILEMSLKTNVSAFFKYTASGFSRISICSQQKLRNALADSFNPAKLWTTRVPALKGKKEKYDYRSFVKLCI